VKGSPTLPLPLLLLLLLLLTQSAPFVTERTPGKWLTAES
jgi:hypothetical protein